MFRDDVEGVSLKVRQSITDASEIYPSCYPCNAEEVVEVDMVINQWSVNKQRREEYIQKPKGSLSVFVKKLREGV